MRWKLEQFEKQSTIKTIFNVKNYEPKLEHEYEIFLYRMIGELLTNVSKHAKATKVAVCLESNGQSHLLSVEDNGVGIELQNQAKNGMENGFGLMSISERVESINGSFSIRSLEQGTIAEIVLPVNN